MTPLQVCQGETRAGEEGDISFHTMGLWPLNDDDDDDDDNDDMVFKVSCAAYSSFSYDDHHRCYH